MAKKPNISKLTHADAAYLAGVTTRTVSNWARESDFKNPDGSVDGRRFVQYLLERQLDYVGGSGGDEKIHEPEEAQKWMTAYRRERAKLAKIERRKEEGKLLSKEEVHSEWAKRVGNLCAGLESLCDRLAPLLFGKTRDEIFAIIKAEVRELRLSYEREGQYCPKVEK